MPAAVRSYVAASAALMGAGVITAAQVVPPLNEDQSRVVKAAVSLAAAVQAAEPCSGYLTEGCDIWATPSYTPVALNQNGSAANIPANLFNAVISVPRALVDAINDLSYALEVTGNWWVYTPTNVLGFDPADPPKATALANLAIPFKPLSNAVGDHFAWWARANLPMNAGCTGSVGPACADLPAILSQMFKAPSWVLNAGYQFPELNNPVSDAEGAVGEEIPGSVGQPVPWSGAYVKLDPADPVNAVINYLLADPAQNTPKPVTLTEISATFDRLGKALNLAFNPYVPMSFLLKGWPYTFLTPLAKPLVPILCPTCNPVDPGLPPVTQQPAASTAILAGATVAEPDIEPDVASDDPDVVPVASETDAYLSGDAGVGAGGSERRAAPVAAVKAESTDADAVLDAELAALADADVDAAGPAGADETAGLGASGADAFGADETVTKAAPTRAIAERRGLAAADHNSRGNTAPADSGADAGEQAGE